MKSEPHAPPVCTTNESYSRLPVFMPRLIERDTGGIGVVGVDAGERMYWYATLPAPNTGVGCA